MLPPELGFIRIAIFYLSFITTFLITENFWSFSLLDSTGLVNDQMLGAITKVELIAKYTKSHTRGITEYFLYFKFLSQSGKEKTSLYIKSVLVNMTITNDDDNDE